MAAYLVLDVDQNSEFSTTINVYDNYGQHMNLASYNAYSQFSQSPYSETVYNFDSTVSDAANGEITISLTSEYSANVRPGRYLYDILIVSPTNTKTRVIEGIVNIYPDITSVT